MKPSVVEWLAAHDKRAEPRHPRSGAPIPPKQPRGTKGGDNKIDRRREPKVRIQLPPGESLQTFGSSRAHCWRPGSSTRDGRALGVTAEKSKLAQMRRDKVIDARRELHLWQVATAGKHDQPSVRQRGSEQFGVRRRRRDAVFLALNHQQGHRKPSSERRHLGLSNKASCLHETGGVGRAKRLLHQNQSIGGGAEPSSAAARSPKL